LVITFKKTDQKQAETGKNRQKQAGTSVDKWKQVEKQQIT